METYSVSYYEEDICHCVLMVDAIYEVEAKNKAIEYMESKDIGYHYWDEYFRIINIKEIAHIK